MTLRTLNYGNCGIFLIMGNAGFVSSIVGLRHQDLAWKVLWTAAPQPSSPNPTLRALNPTSSKPILGLILAFSP